jgi:1,4-alpha-glucan branching enzyme
MSKKSKPHENRTDGAQIGPRIVEVAFALEWGAAREVFLCGDFNQWSPGALRMIRREGDGLWEKRLTLAPGRYEYKFIVDGAWIPDPNGHESAANVFGSTNSVLVVRP